MGTWGTAIFSDDTASDVRDDYRELVGKGLSGTEATDRLIREWGDHPDDAPVFWLALAVTQWRCGRLEQRVKDMALKVIEDGSNLERWEEDATPLDVKKRKAVLEALRLQLESPQPPEKRIPQPFVSTCEWEVGELISYRLKSGMLVIFRVIGYHIDKGGKDPVCEMLDWLGTEIPSKLVLAQLGIKHGGIHTSQFLVGAVSKREFPKDRVERLNIKLKPSQKSGGFSVYLWGYLDMFLEKDFGLS